jgi:hypothetical protein
MVDVQTNIVIHRPVAAVAAYAMDPARAPEWYVNIKSAIWRTQPLVQPGSQIIFIAHFLGKKLEYTYEITEMVADKTLVMKTAQGPFPMETTYQFEPIDDTTTRMTLRNRGKPTGFAKLLSPFIVRMMRNANKKDLKKLRDILENS